MGPLRAVAVIIAITAAFVAPPGIATAESAPCEGFTDVPGQGPSCPFGHVWRVLLAGGGSVLTHGPDGAPPAGSGESVIAATTASDPLCVAAPGARAQVIYARPHDEPDRYAAKIGDIRNLVRQANGVLRADAGLFGHVANYKVACDGGGAISVLDAVLPTGKASDSFSTIVNDLRNAGFTNTDTKYWVWYDGITSPGVAGQGELYIDDRPGAENNHNRGGMFAISYQLLSTRVWMHENGHNMGAVQDSAPHSSGGFHCNDGMDIMCYADGGSTSAFDGSVCTEREFFDCNHDDYFHPAPAPGSYLATHWNIGNAANRFLMLESCGDSSNPVALIDGDTVSGAPAAAGGECHFTIPVAGGTGSLLVDIASAGSADRDLFVRHGSPATGSGDDCVADTAGPAASCSISNPAAGTWWIAVRDSGSSAEAFSITAEARPPNDPPVMTTLGCNTNPMRVDTWNTCGFRATDDSSSVSYTIDWGDGSSERYPGIGYVPAGIGKSRTHRWTDPGTYTITVTATDNGDPALTSAPMTYALVVQPPPCILTRTGSILVGASGVAYPGLTAAWERDIPEACRGKPFTLQGATIFQDFDIAWYDAAGNEISRSSGTGNEAGVIPSNVADALIIFRSGANGRYTLTGYEP